MASDSLFDFVLWAQSPHFGNALGEVESFFQRFPVRLAVASPIPIQREKWIWVKTPGYGRMDLGSLGPHLQSQRVMISSDALTVPLSVTLKLWGAWEEQPETQLWLINRKQAPASHLNGLLQSAHPQHRDPLCPFWGLRRDLIELAQPQLQTQLQFLEIATQIADAKMVSTLEIPTSSAPPALSWRSAARLWWESFYLQSRLRNKSSARA
jgi:hypothetical protein